jgi:hypothetical protein
MARIFSWRKICPFKIFRQPCPVATKKSVRVGVIGVMWT